MELQKKDVIKLVGLTEKQIEKCEEAGVAIQPEKKNQHGHFIYSEQHIDRLWQIRLCYLMGYEIKEMKELILKPDYDREKMLDMQVARLEEEIKKKKELLQMALAMKTTGITLEMLPHHLEMFAGYKFDEIYEVIRQAVNKYNEGSDFSITAMLSECDTFEDDFNKILLEVEGIFGLNNKGYKVDSKYVQRRVGKCFTILCRYFPNSISFFKLLSVLLMPESKAEQILDNEYGEGKGRCLYNAISYYIENSEEKEDPFLYLECVIECMAKERTRLKEERVFSVLHETYEKLTSTMILSEKYKSSFFKIILKDHVGEREVFDERYGKGAAEYVLDIVERYEEQ